MQHYAANLKGRLFNVFATGCLLLAATLQPAATHATPRAIPAPQPGGSARTGPPQITPTPIPPPGALPCARTWRLVPCPSPGGGGFTAIAAVNPSDMWAVGESGLLIEHWDGAAWSFVPAPAVPNDTGLHGVAAVSANDVWAVGDKGIIHWDGTAWSLVPNAPPSIGSSRYAGVTGLASNDEWAVGTTGAINHEQALIEHWDGRAWTVQGSVSHGLGFLRGVAEVAPNDVWAVGYYGLPDGPIVEHWNGSAWADSALPATVSRAYFQSVVAVAANDVWAVGSSVIHWDGSAWSVVSTAPLPHAEAFLSSVTAVRSNDVWAAGSAYTYNGWLPLVEHWDGHTWTSVPLPEAGSFSLNALTAVGPDTLWVAGASGNLTPAQPLVARYSPATPFVDVPPGDPFFSNIYCLVCQGIAGGYDDNTFRPGNLVTRGQLAKLVSNAAGYNDAIAEDQQSFTDVPPGSPFWIYIQRALAHGVVSGYSNGDGTVSFRPNDPVTRGQAAKFVANAAQYTDAIPPAQQSFADVPPGDPTWLYIERAYAHGVIAGYADGTFHPRTTVTRGQTAKFITNALLPACRVIDEH